MNLEERLYTSTEVAKVLGVSLRSVYRYLDQGKLDAEIKTATGRLRFTKQDILNFLYPDGDIDVDVVNSHFSKVTSSPKKSVTSDLEKEKVSPVQVEESAESEEFSEEVYDEKPEEVPAPVAPSLESPVENEEKEEEIDWLAKFRAAAKEYSVDKKEEKPVETVPVVEAEEMDSLSSISNSSKEQESAVQCTYYKSLLGGLKEIAQNIDKVARKSAVDYAFTLHAGLSLEKPLKKPFSMLHVYVDPATEVLFQKMLQLEESDQANAQLCIMTPKDSSVFANKVEKHGLYVVDMLQMREDFEQMGLADEYASLI